MNEERISYGPVDEGPLQINKRLPWRERFRRFVKGQEANRFLWMIVSLIAQSCIFTPGVLGLIFYSGENLPLLLLCTASVMIVFVANLAAAPVTVVLPAFAFSLAIDAAIVLICIGKIIL